MGHEHHPAYHTAETIERQNMFRPMSINHGPTSPPQFVQPQQLQSPTNYSHTLTNALNHGRSPSSDSTSSTSAYSDFSRRACLSLDGSLNTPSDAYRPRGSPTKHRKNTARIEPRSDKHARELELNRKAATKCRNRQKSFVENLQKRCKNEEEKMHLQSSMVQALHDEVLVLRNELMRQSTYCGCQYIGPSGTSAYG